MTHPTQACPNHTLGHVGHQPTTLTHLTHHPIGWVMWVSGSDWLGGSRSYLRRTARSIVGFHRLRTALRRDLGVTHGA